MSEYLYQRGQLDAAVRASDIAAAQRPAKTVCEAAGDLEVTHSIPKELYFNAVCGHGVDPADTEYWRDMERYVPSIKVNAQARRLSVNIHGFRKTGGPRKVRNRFGIISFRKVYR